MLSLALAAAVPALAQVRASDRQALIDFFNATGGPGWTDRGNWLDPPGNECNWHGVDCGNGPDRVTSLDLPRNGLSGPLPAALTRLTALEVLFLPGNALVGTIPPQLADLGELWWLNLSENQLTGTIPAELGSLTKLQRLNLSRNQLVGPIPRELGNLSELELLTASRNSLTGEIPSELGRLSKLDILILGFNELTGELPAEIGQLNNLRYLLIFRNQLSGPIPEALGSLTKLELMSLSRNRFDGSLPDIFARMPSLTGLSVWGNRLTGPVPSGIADLAQLEGLALHWNGLSVEDPRVSEFLDGVIDDDQLETQTVPPGDLLVDGLSEGQVLLRWRPIPYTLDEGGYRVELATSPSGPFQTVWEFDRKVGFFAIIGGLDSAQLYHFRVRAFTLPHANNDNEVVSAPSPVVSARPVQTSDAGKVEFFSRRSGASEGETRGLGVLRLGGNAGKVRARVRVAEGSATLGEDFTVDILDMVWEDGESGIRRSVNAEILEDTEVEEDENFFVDIELLEGSAGVGQLNSFEVKILENDLVEEAGVVDISSTGFEPVLGSASDGSRLVVWSQASSAGSDLVGRFYEPDGTSGETTQISDDGDGEKTAPDVAHDPLSGGFVVVWQNGPETVAPGLRGRRLDDRGEKQGPEFLIDDTAASDHPAVTFDRDGEILVAWERPVPEPRPESLRGGTVAATARSGTALVGRWFDNAGEPLGQEIEIAEGGTESELPELSTNDSNEVLVVWQAKGDSGPRVQARSVSRSGGLGEAFEVADLVEGDQERPEVSGVPGSSEYLVVWQNDSAEEETGDEIFARRVGPQGAVDAPFQVNADDEGSQESPRVVVSDTGECLVGWNSTGSDEVGVFARLLTDCRLSGAGEKEVARPEGSARFTGLVLADDGQVTAVLSPEDRDFGDGGVAARVTSATALSGECIEDGATLCLDSGRFAVQADWADFEGNRGSGRAESLTADTGYFWFFDEDNVEVVVKVLDGCAVNQHYWVFAGGLTNVEVEFRVTDTTTGKRVEYRNQLGVPFRPIQDTQALSGCP